jgi:hypothetical protein
MSSGGSKESGMDCNWNLKNLSHRGSSMCLHAYNAEAIALRMIGSL